MSGASGRALSPIRHWVQNRHATVYFALHCGRDAALPRTAAACQLRTDASQQSAPHSIASSARATSVAGTSMGRTPAPSRSLGDFDRRVGRAPASL